LPPDYLLSDVRKQIEKMSGPRQLNPDKGFQIPLNVFLFQEIQRIQNILALVRKTLTDIVDAIDGQVVLTPVILEAIDSIYDAKVPQFWITDATGVEISWQLLFLGSWFSSFTERYAQLNNWLKN
jgi:dynein heavy chain